MSRTSALMAIAGLCVVAGLAASRSPRSSLPASRLPVLWEAPWFSYPDQDGRPLSKADLFGHVWVANFVFTQCTSACPMMTARMILLQRSIAAPGVRFVSFSVDPEHDTPTVLKTYAHQWNRDEPRWHLLSTTPDGLRATAEGMRLSVQRTGDRSDPILHSNRFLLVDEHGFVRGAYDSSETEAMKRLVADLETLTRRDQPRSSPHARSSSGEALFVDLGCRGCHSQERVAPPLVGLFGAKVTLSDGREQLVDEDYLRRSIVNPAESLVAGYAVTMPSYSGQLTEEQLSALVTYLKSLKGASPAATPQLAVDPVCKMEVTVVASTPHVDRAGKRYHFCGDSCRQQFIRNGSQ